MSNTPQISLKLRALRGGIWVLIGHGAGQGLRLLGNLVLTRLLLPEAFGIMMLVNTILRGLEMLSDVGIQQCIIQNDRGSDPEFYNTGWTLKVYRGVFLWLGTTMIAWPISWFYQNSLFLWLIPVVGLTTILRGVESTSVITLVKGLNLRKVIALNVGSQTVSMVLMIVWALISPTIWVLAFGAIAGAAFGSISSHYIIPGYKNRFVWDREIVRKYINFGKWIFFSSGFTFLAMQSDRLILGKLIPFDLLGAFSIAIMIVEVPRSIVTRLSESILFPAISEKLNLPRHELRAKIIHNRRKFLYAAAVGVSLLSCFGDVIVKLLWPQEYHGAAWMLPILALGLWPGILNNTIASALIALGKPIYSTVGGALRLVLISSGILGVFYLAEGANISGIACSVVVIAFGDIPYYLVFSVGLWRERLSAIRQDMIATGVLIGLLGTLLAVRTLVGLSTPFGIEF